jgi:integrase
MNSQPKDCDDTQAAAVVRDPELDGASLALHQQVEAAVLNIRIAATPSSTLEAYMKALRYWSAWSQVRFGEPLTLPVSVHRVQLFVIDHFGQPQRSDAGNHELTIKAAMPGDADRALVAAGYKRELGRHRTTTIDQRLAVLSWAHRENGLESPCHDSVVRRLLSDCRKLALEHGEGPRSKTAATLAPLDLMLSTCDDSLEGRRDRALLQFGFSSGGRRRSEIAAAECRDIEWIGPDKAIFRMRRSKTQDGGPKPIKGEAALALRVWLEAAQIDEGALFRRLWGKRVGPRLSGHAVAAIVQRRVILAGLRGDYAGHSLRRGFVTQAGMSDVPLSETMAMTGHRLVRSVVRYSEVGEILNSRAADLRSTTRNR